MYPSPSMRKGVRDLVPRCGIDTRNPAGTVIDHTPEAYYTLMLFNTPFMAGTVHGIQPGQAGQMLITAPGMRQYHCGLDMAKFSNDWLHMEKSAVQEEIRRSSLPIGEIFDVSDTQCVRRIITDIMREQLLNPPNAADIIACRVTELILLTERHYIMAGRMASAPAEQVHYEKFCSIRLMVRQSCTKTWSVDRMASMAHLSPNRFAVLYRNFFKVSPIDDVINMRIDEAKRMLSEGTMTVSEVADRCGFSHLNYFSRLFKARTGRTPGNYRRQRRGER